MSADPSLDAILIEWGDRLFYPGNRIVKSRTPRLRWGTSRASFIRSRIEAAVRRAPQVMVKVTGGGRGMAAIRAHFRYISRNGKLEVEDDRGITREGKAALHDLTEQWQHGGSFIDETSHRREAFNVMLSMPRGTDPLIVQRAAREFAHTELKGHRYVMALHDDQANPHVHISVRAESRDGERLNPRKPDVQRWRETFAEKLRDWGVDAEATRQAARGQVRNYAPIWRVKAAEERRLNGDRPLKRSGEGFARSQAFAKEAWDRILEGLAKSESPEDRTLAELADRFVHSTPFAVGKKREPELGQQQQRTRVASDPRVAAVSREDGGIERSR